MAGSIDMAIRFKNCACILCSTATGFPFKKKETRSTMNFDSDFIMEAPLVIVSLAIFILTEGKVSTRFDKVSKRWS